MTRRLHNLLLIVEIYALRGLVVLEVFLNYSVCDIVLIEIINVLELKIFGLDPLVEHAVELLIHLRKYFSGLVPEGY